MLTMTMLFVGDQIVSNPSSKLNYGHTSLSDRQRELGSKRNEQLQDRKEVAPLMTPLIFFHIYEMVIYIKAPSSARHAS